jgi:hypothetical protein
VFCLYIIERINRFQFSSYHKHHAVYSKNATNQSDAIDLTWSKRSMMKRKCMNNTLSMIIIEFLRSKYKSSRIRITWRLFSVANRIINVIIDQTMWLQKIDVWQWKQWFDIWIDTIITTNVAFAASASARSNLEFSMNLHRYRLKAITDQT